MTWLCRDVIEVGQAIICLPRYHNAMDGPLEKVKAFPTTPGVYLMKDAQGRVLYVGKAKNLRNRAAHYFSVAAADDPRTADLVRLIADIDFVVADTEVDALLMEARLI